VGEMNYSPVLAPVVALVSWTCVMLVWVYLTRLPAMRKAGIDLKGRVSSRGSSLEGVLPDNVQWKAHNYTHLTEQPTLFYAVVIGLAFLGDHDPTTAGFAWAYVALRIAHSLVQATVNIVKYRLLLFILSSGVLILLTIRLAALLIRSGA